MGGRVLAVDVGEKRIGIAVSDPTRTIASPLKVIQHVTREVDTAKIAQLVLENQVTLIVVGIPINEAEKETSQIRHILKFVTALKGQTSTPVVTWDESFSTNNAQAVRRIMGAPKKNRSGHLDDLAAAIILQSYLDSQKSEN